MPCEEKIPTQLLSGEKVARRPATPSAPPHDATVSAEADPERWLPVEDYEGFYEVSSRARVRSLDRFISYDVRTRLAPGRILRPATERRTSYLQVNLCRDGIPRTHRVHVLVAQAFVANPNGLPCVDHRDRNPSNNSPHNLKWATQTINNFNQLQVPRGNNVERGVYLDERRLHHRNPWYARVGKRHIGVFGSESEAAAARDAAYQSTFSRLTK